MMKMLRKKDEYGGDIQFDNGMKPKDDVYSDHLYQWDAKKYNNLCQKFFGNHGQYWGSRSPDKIEKFLREYLDKKDLILCRVTEYENKITGDPNWRFNFK